MIACIQERSGKIHYIDYASPYGIFTFCERRFNKTVCNVFSGQYVLKFETLAMTRIAMDNSINNVCPDCLAVFKQFYVGKRLRKDRSRTNANIMLFTSQMIRNFDSYFTSKYLTMNGYHMQRIRSLIKR